MCIYMKLSSVYGKITAKTGKSKLRKQLCGFASRLSRPKHETQVAIGAEFRGPKLEREKMESSDGGNDGERQSRRAPLSRVVSDCARRWFQDTLKEAKSGDFSMQVLVGQMYYSGYGVPKDARKGRIWMSRASRVKSSVWKVSNKRPGYNASDSDSDESEGNS
ncbi:uncharacterized protein LOC130762062 [Actinidia eriantha]|uniref:uncharacterized protein LOC130762062 n=1 Tax=Actinidia eriantha TaxID=165200 RepID=UPI00258749AA|nr:uncharacterized protein LOC130762062 [Actinidia eriantha]